MPNIQRLKLFRIAVLLIPIIYGFQAYAQEGLAVGIKAGTGYSQFYFKRYVEQNFYPVFQGGLVISHVNSKNMGIQFEIMRTQKGWQEQIGESLTKSVVIDYIEFPMLSSMKFGKRNSGLVVNLGLHISYALHVDSSSSGTYIVGDTSLIEYALFKYSKWDYGLRGSLGYQLNLGRNIFQLQITYSQGLHNLFNRDYQTIYRSLNQCLYLNFVYKVSLAKRK